MIKVDTTSTSQAFSLPIIPTGIAKEVSLIQAHHPRIVEKITSLWGSADLNIYLDSLIFDERGGRKGFTETISAALFRVYETHGLLFHTPLNGDIWDVILDRLHKPDSEPTLEK